jgi:PKD repeat protein
MKTSKQPVAYTAFETSFIQHHSLSQLIIDLFRNINLFRFNYLFVWAIGSFLIMAGCKKDDGIVPKPEPQPKITADAGPSQSAKLGVLITLDGSKSKDSKGTALKYNWIFTKKPANSTTVLTNATAVNPTFTADLSGEYEVELTVSNTNGQAKDKVLITITPADLVTLGGEIASDRVLENINPDPTKPDYLVTANLIVKAKLTIKPGVVLEFEADRGMHIYPQGALIAKGTMQERIVFTGKSKTAGFWKGILVESNNLENALEFTTVEFGGSSSYAVLPADIKSNLVLAGSNVGASSLKIANSLFAFSGGYGVYVQGSSELAAFSGNGFSKNTGSAIYLPANQVHKLDAASTFSGDNGVNGVEISGILNQYSEVTWPDLKDGSSYFISSDITIQSGLKIAEGATLEFREGLVLRVDGGYLNAIGTANNKITFTARTKTGNLNWGGLVFNSAQDLNKLQYTEVSYAGNKQIPGFGNETANITVTNTGKVSLTQSAIQYGLGWGVVAFTDLGAKINTDVTTANTFFNLTKGPAKLTFQEAPTTTISGEWVDKWSFDRGYAIDDKFYNRQTNQWFRGAISPWTMNPQAGFGIKISENGNYVWTIAEYGPMVGCGAPYSAEYITGNVTASGNNLTFQESYWRSKFYNPCDQTQNADIDVQPSGMTLRYEINRMYNMLTGEGYWELKITNPDNTFFKYYKH